MINLKFYVILIFLSVTSQIYSQSDQPSVRLLCENIGYISITFLGFFNSFPQSAIFALANIFPESYVGWASIGKASVGLLMYLSSIIAKMIGVGATTFVIIASILIGITGSVILYFIFEDPFASFCYTGYKRRISSSHSLSMSVVQLIKSSLSFQDLSDIEKTNKNLEEEEEETDFRATIKDRLENISQVIWQTKGPVTAMFFILIGCFTAIPGPIMQIVEEGQRKFIMGVFLGTDLLGRTISEYYPNFPVKINVTLSVLRAMFTPLVFRFLQLTLPFGTARFAPLLFTTYLGLSRGYQGTVAAIQSNKLGKTSPVDATNILTFSVVLGTAGGAIFCAFLYKTGFYQGFHTQNLAF
eukprot:GHVP01011592.1.p1 GENE.GHVP01011592.1~~GHVP01011592.1.p1  ORF type:complete len:356 (+),score=47.78 GHVP01011592.1:1716-2783(+)